MVLLLSLIFVALFSSMAFSMLTMSSRNVKVADNHRDTGRAFTSALSGIDVINYHISKISMPGTTALESRYNEVSSQLASSVNLGQSIALSTADDTSFSAQLYPINNERFGVRVTGSAGALTRTINVNYTFGTRQESVFDFGVATKGPLQLSGNIQLDGTNIAVEADVYIESENDNDVLSIIGNSQIAGSVKVTNPDGEVYLQGGQAGIGGDTGQKALDHVTTGVPPTQWPVPHTDHFQQYLVGGDVIDSGSNLQTSYTNVLIKAGTNPHFSANTTINGIMYIETPNVVVFSGSCNITGLIVGDGSMYDDSGTNQIVFTGNVSSHSVDNLPADDSRFDGLRDEKHTFLMAPGFKASFGGNFSTLNGVIAANGIDFFGNAGGTIAGSVINYANTPMTLSGNSDLFFNRLGIDKVPAGFKPEIVLHYDALSYTELAVCQL